MTVTIKQFLQINNITTEDVAREMNISDEQLQKIFSKSVVDWPVKAINALAVITHSNPGEVLDDLQDVDFQLEIDDDAQTIQGVKIEDPAQFKQMKVGVRTTCIQGWEPTPDDIKQLLEDLNDPDTPDRKALAKLLEDDD
ncbi:helix-turn-helix domain-containing protein [Limosilactobacillus sp.]|uniref:helix-turn-helix domain-containing protein n=1 Tax=Limosilactobacillus sp. TaxID=2773925 RepID=UPI00345E9B87